jgi:pimeloyl-ACP methyl ester carboxylesterase
VDDVLGLIRHFGAGEAAIVGHDWGAAVAWASARAHPGSVSRLVAMQVPPFRAWHDNLSLRQLSRSWYILFFQLPRVPEWWIGSDDFAQLAKMFRATSRRGTFADADIAVYKEALSRCSASGETTALTAAINYYRANVFRMAADADAWTPVRVPTLFIYGERDQFVVPETVRGVNRYVESPYSEVRLARAGHWVQQEYPNEVNAALIKFLSGGVSQRKGEKGKG